MFTILSSFYLHTTYGILWGIIKQTFMARCPSWHHLLAGSYLFIVHSDS